jgi:hypothetical protein
MNRLVLIPLILAAALLAACSKGNETAAAGAPAARTAVPVSTAKAAARTVPASF